MKEAPKKEKEQEVVQAQRADLPVHKSFDAMIESVRQRIRQAENQALECYWMIGGEVDRLLSGSVYGKRTVQDLADALGYQPSTIYKYRKFYMRCTYPDLKALLENGVSYNQARGLLALDDEKKEELIENLKSGDITSDELKEQIDSVKEEAENKKGKEDDESDDATKAAAELMGIVKQAMSMLDTFCSKCDKEFERIKDLRDNLAANIELYEKVSVTCGTELIPSMNRTLRVMATMENRMRKSNLLGVSESLKSGLSELKDLLK